MNTIFKQILEVFNTGIGFTGSIITICDHFRNKNNSHIKETFAAIRDKSKDAYKSYCDYCERRKKDIGIPSEEKILGYWESCLERDILPSVDDMVSSNIAYKEEAEIMLMYLLKAWMEVPDFVEWLHDILTQNKLDELSGTLMDFQKSIEGISRLANELEQQNINNIAFPISSKSIVDAKYSCTDSDIKQYYMVDNRFMTMFKVISAEQDIPHGEARQKIVDLAESCHPIIIAGNGGLGKTSLMMHAAVQWASCGRMAVWLSLSNEDVITEQKAAAFFSYFTALIPAEQRGLLCIDNPFEGKTSFYNLQKSWPNNDKIQLIMAERANRLTLLADPDRDCLLYWFDDAQMVILQGVNQFKPTFDLKDYVSYQFPETRERKKEILEKCTSFLVKDEVIKEEDRKSGVQMILREYDKPSVSLVELIYRTLFELKKRASKPESIKLDWEEWGNFIEGEFGKGNSYTQKELYGVIAALKVFNRPITIALFCRFFDLPERKLRNCLGERLMSRHIEPVIYNGDTLESKHDVIAELFFLFHKQTVSINSLMLDLLQCMDENEIETLLAKMVLKSELKKGEKYYIGQIHYRDFMDKIYDRMVKSSCNLSDTGRANLCLGYLWSRFQGSPSANQDLLNDILNKIAPEIDGTHIMATLYTEWGIWARNSGDNTLAEEKYRLVVENYIGKEQLPALTELGILLSKQKGRKKEAEEFLREAMKIDSEHIQSRTELARLLSRQKGREKEAEELLREVMKIKPKDIQSRTELGILLLKQKGREEEAEKFLREAMQIDPKHIQSRTVLARWYERNNRQAEAVELYQEVCKYKPGDFYGMEGLERLKEYIIE